MKRLITPPGMSAPDAGETQQQININPKNLEDVTCDKCGSYTFAQVNLIKRMSPLQSPTGREAFVPVQVFACNACGHINDRFIEGMQGWFKQKEEAPKAADGIVTSELQTVAVEDDGA